MTWILGDTGEDCNTVCRSQPELGLMCVSGDWGISSNDQFQAAIRELDEATQAEVTCDTSSPHAGDWGRRSPFVGVSNPAWCGYTSWTLGGDTCENGDANVRRLCKCVPDPSAEARAAAEAAAGFGRSIQNLSIQIRMRQMFFYFVS